MKLGMQLSNQSTTFVLLFFRRRRQRQRRRRQRQRQRRGRRRWMDRLNLIIMFLLNGQNLPVAQLTKFIF